MEKSELEARLAALRSGDRTAFEEIYNSLKTPVYTVIVRIVRNRETAEDVLQEVFVKLFRSPPAADVKNPRAYILKTARNMALDAVKKSPSDDSLDEMGDRLTAGEGDTDGRLDVEGALAALDGTDCRIVTLHLNAGLAFREVAEIEAMPLGTVLWRYRRALSRLRDRLSEV